ncbi:MAG: phage terminase large subunit [Alphaproteobacteria bacterium]
MSNRRVINAVLRQDLASFIAKCFTTLNPGTRYLENWHIRYIAHALTVLGAGQRLAINLPPRYGKSLAVTIAYTAWLLGHNPALRIMVISYSEKLARQHALDFRTIVESAWYRELFPEFRIARGTDLEIKTTRQGYRLASSMDGTILGRGADIIILDDPLKVQSALSKIQRERINQTFDLTIYSRLNNKNEGRIILVGHRLHENDLVGHVMAREEWQLIVIPAVETEDRSYVLGPHAFQIYQRRAGEPLHPERESLIQIEAARRNLGSAGFAAQYQQNPIPDSGTVIQREWIRYCDRLPARFDLVLASWDTACTQGDRSDYSVGTVWGLLDTTMYLLAVVRGRWEVPELRRRVVAVSIQYGASPTLIEKTDIGRAIVQELGRGHAINPILRRPIGEKVVRMLSQSARFEAGQVVLPREAEWLGDYLSEILGFPNGRHDDQVDSTSQALEWLSHQIRLHQLPRRTNPRRSNPIRR